MVARRFPVRIGRATGMDFQSDEAGVWNEHLRIEADPATGCALVSETDALVSLNGSPAQRAVLRNGDVLDAGSLKLRFWLEEAPQKGLRSREAVVWFLLGLVTLGQITVILWLHSRR